MNVFTFSAIESVWCVVRSYFFCQRKELCSADLLNILNTSREAAADTCGLPLLNRSLQNVYLRASLVKRVSNWFKLAHGIFWVRCTFEKTAGVWQKWTPERSKSKCFHSLWINFRRKNWFKLANGVFWVRYTFEKTVGFWQKWTPETPKSKCFHSLRINFCRKNVQIGSLHLLGAVYFQESGWFSTKVDVQEAKIKMLPFYVRLVSIGSRCLLGALYLWENGWFLTKVVAREAKIKFLSFYVNQFTQKKFAQICL